MVSRVTQLCQNLWDTLRASQVLHRRESVAIRSGEAVFSEVLFLLQKAAEKMTTEMDWELKICVTDLQVERTIRVKSDLHIGGVMIKLVDDLGKEKGFHFFKKIIFLPFFGGHFFENSYF